MSQFKRYGVLCVSVISFLSLSFPLPALAKIADDIASTQEDQEISDSTVAENPTYADSTDNVVCTTNSTAITPTSNITTPTSNDSGGYTWDQDFKVLTLTGTVDGVTDWMDIQAHNTTLEKVVGLPGSALTGNMTAFFAGCQKLSSIEANDTDTSKVTSMSSMFSNTAISDLTGIANWSLAGLSGDDSMAQMFGECPNLKSLNGLQNWTLPAINGYACLSGLFINDPLEDISAISNWDVSNISGELCLASMFSGTSITSLDDLASWNVDTITGAKKFKGMFAGCKKLESIDGIKNWSTTAENSLEMFKDCTRLDSLTVGNFIPYTEMQIPATYYTGGNYWWPDNSQRYIGFTTNEMITASSYSGYSGVQWTRSPGSMITANVEGQGSITSRIPAYPQRAGTTIRISFLPATGWLFKDGNFIVTDSKGENIPVTPDGITPDDNNYVYKFIMPINDVTVKVIFTQPSPDPGPDPTPSPIPGPDINFDFADFNFDFTLPHTGDFSRFSYWDAFVVAIIITSPFTLCLLCALVIKIIVKHKTNGF